jgi:hypothetical protein
MTTSTHFIEIIFENHISPGDLEIIAAATYDQPGQVRLGQARVEAANGTTSRVNSANGGAFIGVIGSGSPEPPYNFSYWLLPLSPLPLGGVGGGREAIAETKELTQ